MISEILGVKGYSGLSEVEPISPFIPADKVRPITIEDLVARTAG